MGRFWKVDMATFKCEVSKRETGFDITSATCSDVKIESYTFNLGDMVYPLMSQQIVC